MKNKSSFNNIIKRQWLPSTIVFVVAFLSIGYLRAMINKPLYKAIGQILIESTNTNNQSSQNLSNNLALIESQSLADKVLQDLDYAISREDLKENFAVNTIEENKILELSFISNNPQQSALVVNSWLENYLESIKEDIQQGNQSVNEFLEQQLPKSQQSLNLATEKLRKFQEKNQIIDATIEANAILQNISDLEIKIATFQAQLETLNARKQSLQNIIQIDPQKATIASVISESPMTSSILKQLQEVEIQIKQKEVVYGEQHPEIINLRQKEKILRVQLQNDIDQNSTEKAGQNINQSDLERTYQLGKTEQKLFLEYTNIDQNINNIQGQIKSIQNLINNYKQRIDKLRELEFEQQKLKREIATQEQIVQNLRANYQEAKITKDNSEDNLQSVKFASVPEKSINPSFYEYMIQGIIAGIILSLLTAILLNKFNQQDHHHENLF